MIQTLFLQSEFRGWLCPPTRLWDGGTDGWFWFRLRWVLSWTRSVSQALAPWGGASPASPLAGEGGPTKALGGNDRPGPDTTGAPLPLPIRGPVSTFFGQDCIGHGQPWKAASTTNYSIINIKYHHNSFNLASWNLITKTISLLPPI